MYKKVSGSVVVFLVLYVDDILLIGNNFSVLQSVKIWLSKNFSMPISCGLRSIEVDLKGFLVFHNQHT